MTTAIQLIFMLAFGFICLQEISAETLKTEGRCDDEHNLCVIVRGSIGAKDLNQFSIIAEQTPSPMEVKPIIVFLDSYGGDVFSAIELGREFRRLRVRAYVDRGDSCLSSCIFLLAGAPYRTVYRDKDNTEWPEYLQAKVGIHRPYPESIDYQSLESRQGSHRKIENYIKSFFSEMNIPESLFDAIVGVAPEYMHILTNEELTYYGLNRTDPVQEEADNAIGARRSGIGIREYLVQKRRIQEECVIQKTCAAKDLNCEWVSELLQCHIDILSGKR